MTNRNGGKSAVQTLRESGCTAEVADRLAAALDWPLPEADPTLTSTQLFRHAAPLIAEQGRRAWRRRVAGLLAVAGGALPLSAGVAWLTLAIAAEFLSGWLPQAIVTYLLATYVATALVVVGSLYALIPIVVDRSFDRSMLASASRGMQ